MWRDYGKIHRRLAWRLRSGKRTWCLGTCWKQTFCLMPSCNLWGVEPGECVVYPKLINLPVAWWSPSSQNLCEDKKGRWLGRCCAVSKGIIIAKGWWDSAGPTDADVTNIEMVPLVKAWPPFSWYLRDAISLLKLGKCGLLKRKPCICQIWRQLTCPLMPSMVSHQAAKVVQYLNVAVRFRYIEVLFTITLLLFVNLLCVKSYAKSPVEYW